MSTFQAISTALVSLLGVGAAAAAESDTTTGALEEVTVTATKTGAKDLQDVALAVTAFSADQLERSGVKGIEGLAQLTPGFNVTANGPYAINSVRGIGTNNTFVGGDPSVTVQVDGVYIGRPTASSGQLLDVERIEVLRGPQGTLYGRNATGGTINIITKMPSQVLGGEAKVTGGTKGTYAFEGWLNVPLLRDDLSLLVTGADWHHDAYITNLAPGAQAPWTDSQQAVRAKLLWKPVDGMSVTVAGDYTRDKGYRNWYYARLPAPGNPLGGGAIFDGLATPDVWTTASNFPNYDSSTFKGLSITATAAIADMTLNSITAYRSWEMTDNFDIDMSALSLARTVVFPESSDQFSQELSLTGKTAHLEWVTGAFLYHEKASSYFNLQLSPELAGSNLLQTSGDDTATDSVAVFAQGTYAFNDRLSATAGARYTSDHKDAVIVAGVDVGQPFPVNPYTQAISTTRTPRSAAWAQTTPKIELDYKPVGNVMMYGSVTRGYKSGGVNIIGGNVYGPETVWAYEGGIKSTLLAGRATLNLALFDYDYKGYQVLQFIGTGQEFVSNSKKVQSKGGEIEATLRLTSAVKFGGNVAFLSATYDDPDLFTTNDATQQRVSADGNSLTDAPRWSGSLFGEYAYTSGLGALRLHADVLYKDKVYYSPANDSVEVSPAHTVANASLSYATPDGHWEASVLGQNLFNRQYITGASYFVVIGGRPGLPRIVTASLKYNF